LLAGLAKPKLGILKKDESGVPGGMLIIMVFAH